MVTIVAILISSTSLILSAFMTFRTLLKDRFATDVSCLGYDFSSSELRKDYRRYLFYFLIDNLSSIPLSVSYIQVHMADDSFTTFTLTKRFMKQHFIPPGLDNPYDFLLRNFQLTSQVILLRWFLQHLKTLIATKSNLMNYQELLSK